MKIRTLALPLTLLILSGCNSGSGSSSSDSSSASSTGSASADAYIGDGVLEGMFWAYLSAAQMQTASCSGGGSMSVQSEEEDIGSGTEYSINQSFDDCSISSRVLNGTTVSNVLIGTDSSASGEQTGSSLSLTAPDGTEYSYSSLDQDYIFLNGGYTDISLISGTYSMEISGTSYTLTVSDAVTADLSSAEINGAFTLSRGDSSGTVTFNGSSYTVDTGDSSETYSISGSTALSQSSD